MLTKTMCAQWGPNGVQANAIAPGYVDTVLTSALVADPQFSAWVESRTPARRWGRPQELIGTLLWLAPDASNFVNGQVVLVGGQVVLVNGQVVFVDGGMTAVV